MYGSCSIVYECDVLTYDGQEGYHQEDRGEAGVIPINFGCHIFLFCFWKSPRAELSHGIKK